jgi:hypothetical protein
MPKRQTLTFPLHAAACAAACLALGAGACRLPTVDIGTREPIRVDPIDIRMRVDVYQHSGDAPPEEEQQRELAAVVESQRNRIAQVQDLKNSRWVGENHRGLLSIREMPAGKDGEWVRTTVEAENADRLFLMRAEAQRRDVLLSEIEAEQWKTRTDDAFEGEWVEAPGPSPDTYRWVQKGKEGE